MNIYRMRPVSGGVVYVSVASHADIALRDLGMQVGRPLTFEANGSKPEYMIGKGDVVAGEQPNPKFTIPVYINSE